MESGCMVAREVQYDEGCRSVGHYRSRMSVFAEVRQWKGMRTEDYICDNRQGTRASSKFESVLMKMDPRMYCKADSRRPTEKGSRVIREREAIRFESLPASSYRLICHFRHLRASITILNGLEYLGNHLKVLWSQVWAEVKAELALEKTYASHSPSRILDHCGVMEHNRPAFPNPMWT